MLFLKDAACYNVVCMTVQPILDEIDIPKRVNDCNQYLKVSKGIRGKEELVIWSAH